MVHFSPSRVSLLPVLLLTLWSYAGCDERSEPATAPTTEPTTDAGTTDVACLAAESYGPPSVVGSLDSDEIVEASGLGASRRHPGVLYVHNDSGGPARFFAIDAVGKLLQSFSVFGATAVDWEDAATGPCPSGTCLYLADVGDNARARTSYAIYRVPEPALSPGAVDTAVEADWLPFVYPDGSHNAEAALVHPQTGDLYILTKVSGLSRVYRLPAPQRPGETVTLEYVTEMTLPQSPNSLVTAATLHPCGDRLLLRTYARVFEYLLTEGQPFAALFSATPRSLPSAEEVQGEAIDYRADGMGYFTVSEGANAPLHYIPGN